MESDGAKLCITNLRTDGRTDRTSVRDASSQLKGRELVNGFNPLNDAAERAVKFGSNFNGVITYDLKHEVNGSSLQGRVTRNGK